MIIKAKDIRPGNKIRLDEGCEVLLVEKVAPSSYGHAVYVFTTTVKFFLWRDRTLERIEP